MSTRFQFSFSGYEVKIPHSAKAALEEELGVELQRDDNKYRRHFNAAAEGEPANYQTEERMPDDAAEYFYAATHTEYEADLVKVRAIVPPSVGIEVKGIGNPKPLIDLVESIQRIESRLAHAPPPGTNSDRYVNTKVDVHIPGNALLMIDEVMLLEDSCTDDLNNNYLERGWRIVAVCPQPDQRRPDYILGRRKQAEE